MMNDERDRVDEPVGPSQPPQRETLDQRMASMTNRGTFTAFQLGATLVASAGGLIVYGLLVNAGTNNFVALLIGLVFALLARRAATSLMLMRLHAEARQRGASTPQPPAAPPPPA
jgi:hypothetical protein